MPLRCQQTGLRHGQHVSVSDSELHINCRRSLSRSNDFGVFYLNQSLPFGGAKASGYHRFGGPEGLRSLCNVKAITEDRLHGWVQTSIPGPLTYPVKQASKSWRFIESMIDLMYAPSMSRRIAGLFGMATA